MPRSFVFDPDRVAWFETEGWRAYYDRRWRDAFALLMALSREQFAMPPLRAFRAAIETTHASLAFAPKDNRPAVALRHLERFYALAQRSVGLAADPGELAALELDYWIVHRALVPVEDKRPLEQSLARLHAALFALSEAAAMPSAIERAAAATAVDRITNGWSQDEAADWAAVEHHLQAAYRAVLEARSRG